MDKRKQQDINSQKLKSSFNLSIIPKHSFTDWTNDDTDVSDVVVKPEFSDAITGTGARGSEAYGDNEMRTMKVSIFDMDIIGTIPNLLIN